MSDEPLTNRAVELRRAGFETMSAGAEPPSNYFLADDFEYDDRRTGISFGRLDASEFSAALDENWHLDPADRPRFTITEVLAVKGDRSAVIVERVDYSDDTYIEYLGVFSVDKGFQNQRRYTTFDVGDAQRALAELDRIHAETDD